MKTNTTELQNKITPVFQEIFLNINLLLINKKVNDLMSRISLWMKMGLFLNIRSFLDFQIHQEVVKAIIESRLVTPRSNEVPNRVGRQGGNEKMFDILLICITNLTVDIIKLCSSFSQSFSSRVNRLPSKNVNLERNRIMLS